MKHTIERDDMEAFNTNNINIERAVLSTIIFEPATLETVQAILTVDDFVLTFHKYVYNAVCRLAEAGIPVDEEFVRQYLMKHGKMDEASMLDILATNPIANIKAYATEIKDLSVKRILQNKMRKLLTADNPYEIFSGLEELLDSKINLTDDYFDEIDINSVVEEEPQFILKNWLPFPQNSVSMVVGRGGDGKSMLLLQVLIRYCLENPGKKALGWLSEDTKGITKHRAVRITEDILCRKLEDVKGLTILGSDSKAEPFHIVSWEPIMTISDKWHRLKQQFKDYDLIVLDPLIAFYGGEENNNTQARVFGSLLNSWASKNNITIILIHHATKDKEVKQRGAGALRDAVRLSYVVEADPNDERNRTLYPEKDNWNAKKYLNLDERGRVSRRVFPKLDKIPVIVEEKTNRKPKFSL